MWADEAALDATQRRLDEWESTLADRARRAQSLATRVAALNGTAHSPDHTVEVTVDSAGRLVDLRLDDRVRQHSAAHTARLIVATTRTAYADLLRRVTVTTRETVGADDPTGQAVVDSYRRRLGDERSDPDADR
ncbi:YbaB/EbfC family nucleoid-associated protein [Micromonospora craniellae]|uniref:YbaB/EbfC family DNA-binding protein n=1 Tax=Micromonospora craniellae TaxID=2294034 RepID=A0A372G270_9ACTN|nr:YbaB/EbfC family nucleoid-associated protein [Micromonospora craniellae]QOC91777.1 YbaB/EbfC family nucleoid-associated protein [Micromonospora craniellae]RFS47151.1 YbaB/EbfC family DNA-binding protein [Micromonospora craniellae]